MFGADTVVGEVTDPQGSLKIGNIGDTECVYFSYASTSGDRQFQVVYTGRELSGLIATAKKAQGLASSLKPRSTIRLAAQPPKPVKLQVVLVAPENRPPVVILRFSGEDWKQDVFSAPDALLDLLQKAERKAPMPGVVGTLDRFGPSIWMVEGQTLEVRDDVSHGTGFYREYMHHTEVPESTAVRAWATTVEGKTIVVAFEYAQTWEPSGSIDLPQGQQGDQALVDGQVRHSREIHAVLSKTMFETGRVDPVWSGKITLASLIGDIVMSDEKTAQATWSGEGGNPVLKSGIQSLKAGSLSPHDNAVFSILSAYFSATGQEPAQAVSGINQHMQSAWEFARYNEPEMLRVILVDWYLLLKKVSRGATSGPAYGKWEEAKGQYDHTVLPTVFSLPAPAPWVKSWQPALTSTPKPAAAPPPVEKPKNEEIKLPPLPDRPRPDVFDNPPVVGVEPTLPEGAEEDEGDEQATPWSDELMSIEDGKKSGKKSPLPLIVVLLVVVVGGGYFAMQKFGHKPTVEASATPTPEITATAAPVVTATPTVKPSATPQVPVAGPLPPGDITINGFKVDGQLKEQDIFAAGYEPIDRFPEDDKGVARYKGPKGEVIVNFKLPSRVITAIQGDHLEIDGKEVADLTAKPERFEGDDRFSKYKLQATVDDEGKVRAYTYSTEGIYIAEPIVGSAPKALEYNRKIRNTKFFETLPEGVANMRLTNGETIIFEYLGAFDLDRLKYLIEQGADPNAKCWVDGGTPLHYCKDVKTAALLIKLGANPNVINNKAQTPYDAAETDELKAVLNPEKYTTKASPTPAPATATPAAGSPTPAATPKSK